MEDGEARHGRETGRGDGPPPPSRGQEGGGSDADVGSAVADECWQGVQQLGGAVAAAAPAGAGAKAPAGVAAAAAATGANEAAASARGR